MGMEQGNLGISDYFHVLGSFLDDLVMSSMALAKVIRNGNWQCSWMLELISFQYLNGITSRKKYWAPFPPFRHEYGAISVMQFGRSSTRHHKFKLA